MLGNRNSVDEVIAAADLLLLPSELESFGLAALEAMANRTVPITTDTGGLPEVVEHGKTGFMAPVGGIDQMVEYAVRLLTNDSLRQQMESSARTHALKYFNLQDALKKYENLYRNAIRVSGNQPNKSTTH